MEELTSREKAYLLKEYLGVFFVEVTENDVKNIKNSNVKLESAYLNGSNKALKKMTAFLLLSKGTRLEYKYTTTSELLSTWLGKSEYEDSPSNRTHLDLHSPVLILHNLKYSPPNKSLDLLITQQIIERFNRNLITVMLDESNLSEVRKAMCEYDIKVYDKTADSILNMSRTDSIEFKDPVL